MILRLTPKTAALVGETPAEWQLLEKEVRAGRTKTGAREDAGRLQQLAAELGVAVREEGVVAVAAAAGSGEDRTAGSLAAKAKISRGYLARHEAAEQDPTLGVLERLAQALGVPVTRLLE
jgi:transcriptional regulator with XRE-family HTH domain